VAIADARETGTAITDVRETLYPGVAITDARETLYPGVAITDARETGIHALAGDHDAPAPADSIRSRSSARQRRRSRLGRDFEDLASGAEGLPDGA
jgi:hypothetical protein